MTENRHPADDRFGLHGLVLLLCRVATGVAVPLLSACSGPFSTLDPAGPAAGIATTLWWGMFAFFTLVLVAVSGVWLYAMFREPDAANDQRAANAWITGGGLVLPLTSIAVLLAFGIPAGQRMHPAPVEDDGALRIEVTGHQWWWDVYYPDSGIRLRDELHIPVGVPVDLELRSADVIHSFWVPRLAGKLDMIPGHTNVLRLQADVPGIYRGQCAEFCGLMHAHMQFVLEAHEPGDFQAWQEAHTGD